MSPEEKRDLLYRCRRALAAPVPASVRDGNVRSAADYKAAAQACAAYLRDGKTPDRARLHVLRLEGAQGLLP